MSTKLSKRSSKKYRIPDCDSDGSVESLYSQIQTEEQSRVAAPDNCFRVIMIIFLSLSAFVFVLTEASKHILGVLERARGTELRGSGAFKGLKAKLAAGDIEGDGEDGSNDDDEEDRLAASLQQKLDKEKISAEIYDYQNDSSDTLSIHQALLRPKSSRTRTGDGMRHIHGKEFKTRSRILSLGGSTTWGSKLGDRDQAYPSMLARKMGVHWDFVNLAVRATDAAYASQCIESMVREGSKSIDDMVADFDIILLEYSLNGLDGLPLLLSRLRRRYPNAVIVYVHLWSLRMTVDNAETGEKPRAVLNDAHNFEEADSKINDLLSDPHTGWKWSDAMMADSKQMSMDALDAALKVGGFVYDFPVPENPKEAMQDGWFAKDYHHLSHKGHQMVAEGIYELLKRPEIKPKDDVSSKYMEHTWGKGDSCYSWFETGGSLAVNFQGGNMKMFVNPDKWALHVGSDKPATIKFRNHKSEAQPVELVIMSWGEGVYPKANVRLSLAHDSGTGEQSFLLNPVHPLEWQRIYHITRTVHVGWAEPGKNEIVISPVETTERPLRVTGIVMCGACVEMDPTYLSVDVGQGHGELEHAENIKVSVPDSGLGFQTEQATAESVETTDPTESGGSVEIYQLDRGSGSPEIIMNEEIQAGGDVETEVTKPEGSNDNIVGADTASFDGPQLINGAEDEAHNEDGELPSVGMQISSASGDVDARSKESFEDNETPVATEAVRTEDNVDVSDNDSFVQFLHTGVSQKPRTSIEPFEVKADKSNMVPSRISSHSDVESYLRDGKLYSNERIQSGDREPGNINSGQEGTKLDVSESLGEKTIDQTGSGEGQSQGEVERDRANDALRSSESSQEQEKSLVPNGDQEHAVGVPATLEKTFRTEDETDQYPSTKRQPSLKTYDPSGVTSGSALRYPDDGSLALTHSQNSMEDDTKGPPDTHREENTEQRSIERESTTSDNRKGKVPRYNWKSDTEKDEDGNDGNGGLGTFNRYSQDAQVDRVEKRPGDGYSQERLPQRGPYSPHHSSKSDAEDIVSISDFEKASDEARAGLQDDERYRQKIP